MTKAPRQDPSSGIWLGITSFYSSAPDCHAHPLACLPYLLGWSSPRFCLLFPSFWLPLVLWHFTLLYGRGSVAGHGWDFSDLLKRQVDRDSTRISEKVHPSSGFGFLLECTGTSRWQQDIFNGSEIARSYAQWVGKGWQSTTSSPKCAAPYPAHGTDCAGYHVPRAGTRPQFRFFT